MKNRLSAGLSSLGFLLLLFSHAGAADKLRVGFGTLSGSHMVLYVAKEFGLYQKYGLDAEIVGHIPGAKSVVPLLSGDAQVIHAAGPPFVSGTLAGNDVVIFLGLANTMPFYIVAHKDLSHPSQLKGKRLGVSTLGSSSDFSLRFGLRKLGIDPERDVTILGLGDSAIRASALNNGIIHGGAFSGGEVTVLQKFGHRVVLDLPAAGIEYQATAAATTQFLLKTNRKILLSHARAIIDAMSQMTKRKEETLKIMGKYLRIENREALEAQYEENVIKLYSRKPYPTLNGVKAILENLAIKDERARLAKPEQFVELSIVKELDESGFIDRLYK
jgi:NitT/TauT family transport system substrate-binding protein